MLALRSEQCAPHRSTEGDVLRTLLDRADGRATFGDLARLLHERFAARFPSTQSALDYELKGTLGINAGPLGTPTIGPRTWLRGSLTVQNPLRAGR